MEIITSNIKFAEVLFNLYPAFIPTQALYLDLEGNGGGQEEILSLYWPALSGEQRFSWIKRSDMSEIDMPASRLHLESIGAQKPKWVVVYSSGQDSPDEKRRVIDLLSKDPFPDCTWLNLLHVVQQCPEIKSSIRENRYVWHGSDQIRVRYSLEALEWEFGIERPLNLRSHSFHYRDLDGGPGSMEVLNTANRSKDGTATEDEESSLLGYCKADVKNMFDIAYACEQSLFSKSQRRKRRRGRLE